MNISWAPFAPKPHSRGLRHERQYRCMYLFCVAWRFCFSPEQIVICTPLFCLELLFAAKVFTHDGYESGWRFSWDFNGEAGEWEPFFKKSVESIAFIPNYQRGPWLTITR